MADTARYVLPLLGESQSNPEVPYNDGLNVIDGLFHCCVKDRDLSSPPGSPADGDCYIVDTGASGAWSGQSGKLAIYASGWVFRTIKKGFIAYVEDEDILILWNGTSYGTITVT